MRFLAICFFLLSIFFHNKSLAKDDRLEKLYYVCVSTTIGIQYGRYLKAHKDQVINYNHLWELCDSFAVNYINNLEKNGASKKEIYYFLLTAQYMTTYCKRAYDDYEDLKPIYTKEELQKEIKHVYEQCKHQYMAYRGF